MTNRLDIRILHIDTGNEWRGGQGQVFTLMKQLRKRKINQWLLCPPGSPLFAKAAEARLQVEPMKVVNDFHPGVGSQLANMARRCNSTILHAHDAHAHSALHRAVKHLPNVAAVVSRRVDFAIKGNFFSKRKYLNPRLHYFAISNGVKQVLMDGGVAEERILLVPSGVDPKRFTFDKSSETIRNEFNIPSGAPLIGTIGSLVDHKDHMNMINAVPGVLEHFPDARFLIVGEGEMRAALEERVAELGLEDKILMPGFRSDIEVFLAAFNVFVVSSHLEGLCTSLIDAMLHDLPCVGTDTGGVPDLVKDEKTGLLVPPRDSDALAGAVNRLLGDKRLARNLGENAREHVEKYFTAHALGENTLRAYEHVLHNNIIEI
jgi:L-malate glycosyltransferase